MKEKGKKRRREREKETRVNEVGMGQNLQSLRGKYKNDQRAYSDTGGRGKRLQKELEGDIIPILKLTSINTSNLNNLS